MDLIDDDVLFDEIFGHAQSSHETCNDLHAACLAKDSFGVEEALLTNIDINEQTPSSYPEFQSCTALHIAVMKNCYNITELLLCHGADLTMKDAKGLTPVSYAILKRRGKILECILTFILQKQKFISRDMDGFIFLHAACMLKNIDLALKFVQLTNDINHRICKQAIIWPDLTPLHVAVKYNRIEIARMLISHGADVTITAGPKRLTPLHIAYSHGCRKMINWLLSVHDGRTNPENDDGLSSFDIACIFGKTEVVKRFLRHRPRINLNIALLIATKHSRMNVVRLLSDEYDVDVEWVLLESGYSGIGNHSHRLISQLIREGHCDFKTHHVSAFQPDQFPLFHHACARGFHKVVKILLKHGMNPNDVSQTSTPLQLAVVQKHEKVVKLLLESGASPHVTTSTNPLNALDNLVMHRGESSREERYYFNVISYLIDAGMDQDDINQALCRSVVNPFAAKALLQYGADVNYVNPKTGKTALWHFFGVHFFFLSCLLDNLNTYFIFRTHLEKLQIIGLPISPENKELFEMVTRRYERQYLRTFKYTFINQCEEECEKLIATRVSPNCSLYDVIFIHDSDMIKMMRNPNFESIVKGGDFDGTYPMYGFLLKHQCRIAAQRRPLIESANLKFRQIFESSDWASLPDTCSRKIFEFMTNQELKFLSTS